MSKKGVNEDFLANMKAKQAAASRNWTPATEAEIADNEALKAMLARRLADSDESTKVVGKPVQQPSVGRVVHFTPDGHSPTVHAAIICKVNDDGSVNLVVFDWDGIPYQRKFVFLADAPAGSREAVCGWSWPAFVPPKPVG